MKQLKLCYQWQSFQNFTCIYDYQNWLSLLFYDYFYPYYYYHYYLSRANNCDDGVLIIFQDRKYVIFYVPFPSYIFELASFQGWAKAWFDEEKWQQLSPSVLLVSYGFCTAIRLENLRSDHQCKYILLTFPGKKIGSWHWQWYHFLNIKCTCWKVFKNSLSLSTKSFQFYWL